MKFTKLLPLGVVLFFCHHGFTQGSPNPDNKFWMESCDAGYINFSEIVFSPTKQYYYNNIEIKLNYGYRKDSLNLELPRNKLLHYQQTFHEGTENERKLNLIYSTYASKPRYILHNNVNYYIKANVTFTTASNDEEILTNPVVITQVELFDAQKNTKLCDIKKYAEQ